MSQPDTWLDAFLSREADTVRHMGPRETAKRIAFASYHLPAPERVGILSSAGKLGLCRLTILGIWANLSSMEFGMRRLAA